MCSNVTVFVVICMWFVLIHSNFRLFANIYIEIASLNSQICQCVCEQIYISIACLNSHNCQCVCEKKLIYSLP